MLNLERQQTALGQQRLFIRWGRVMQVGGMSVEVMGLETVMGDLCLIEREGRENLRAEVVGFRGRNAILQPFGDLEGVGPKSLARTSSLPLQAPIGAALLGRVLDAFGNPIDKGGPLEGIGRRGMRGAVPNPLTRMRIQHPLATGVKAIDALITCGKGQRVGIFSGSGVGKSTLLGMIAKGAQADVNVIAMVGERGREIREFLERDLGPGLQKSVVITSTSDQPALVRLTAAKLATTIAEDFRERGMDVLLIVDSVTRVANAQREIGLAAGEPPSARGYPMSVFAMLSRLLERAGASGVGTITGFYTVLVDGDDTNEPVADATRSYLDGHIMLSRDLTHMGHFPPIDVPSSLSRVMTDIVPPEHLSLATKLRSLLSAYEESRDLIEVGAYAKGSNPLVDEAIALRPKIQTFLRQERNSGVPYAVTLASLQETLQAGQA